MVPVSGQQTSDKKELPTRGTVSSDYIVSDSSEAVKEELQTYPLNEFLRFKTRETLYQGFEALPVEGDTRYYRCESELPYPSDRSQRRRPIELIRCFVSQESLDRSERIRS